MRDIIIQNFLEGVFQIHNSKLIDYKYGCGKIRDYHKKRLCRTEMKKRILMKRLANCMNEKCRAKLKSQIMKWQIKNRKELMKSKINMNPEKL